MESCTQQKMKCAQVNKIIHRVIHKGLSYIWGLSLMGFKKETV